ncbi:MAG: TetR/AcrR family transcriptional regulator [Anaerolineae bacterium]|nr:TetR/AcrR family transcriptional regulator [Anaerolineae bacterium]
MDPKITRREQTRRLIIAKAIEIVTRQGPESLSMRVLAEQVQRSPAALYKYFAGKEAILEAVRAHALQCMADAFVEGEAGAANELDKVRAACRTMIRFAEAQPQLYQLIYERQNGSRPNYKQIFNTFHFRYMQDRLRLAKRANLLNLPEGFTVELLVLQLWTCMHGVITLRQTLMAEEPIFEKVTDRLIDQMLANLEHPRDQWQILPAGEER